MAVEKDVQEDTFLGQKCHKITIFLSLFNVHVNRAPMEGRIQYQSYTQGRFLPAYKDTVGFENERGAIGIEGKHQMCIRDSTQAVLSFTVPVINEGKQKGILMAVSYTHLIRIRPVWEKRSENSQARR